MGARRSLMQSPGRCMESVIPVHPVPTPHRGDDAHPSVRSNRMHAVYSRPSALSDADKHGHVPRRSLPGGTTPAHAASPCVSEPPSNGRVASRRGRLPAVCGRPLRLLMSCVEERTPRKHRAGAHRARESVCVEEEGGEGLCDYACVL